MSLHDFQWWQWQLTLDILVGRPLAAVANPLCSPRRQLRFCLVGKSWGGNAPSGYTTKTAHLNRSTCQDVCRQSPALRVYFCPPIYFERFISSWWIRPSSFLLCVEPHLEAYYSSLTSPYSNLAWWRLRPCMLLTYLLSHKDCYCCPSVNHSRLSVLLVRLGHWLN